MVTAVGERIWPLVFAAALWGGTAHAQTEPLAQLMVEASQGDVTAQFSLGDYYAFGDRSTGRMSDTDRALTCYCQAAVRATPEQLILKAKEVESWQTFPEHEALASQLLRIAAIQQGPSSGTAREILGARYAGGISGLPRDFPEAYFWLSLMPEGNSPRAAELLQQLEGALSGEQLQGARDRLAVAKVAQRYFGPDSGRRGIDLYLDAAPCSKTKSAVVVQPGPEKFSGQLGNTTPVKPSARIEALQSQASYGSQEAQRELARHYARGDDKSLSQDWSEAFFWLSIVDTERGAEPESSEIASWRDQAAGHLTPDQLTAAQQRVQAWKPQQEPDPAQVLLSKANTGDPSSIKAMCRSSARRQTPYEGLDSARDWCLKAASMNDPEAEINLARFYETNFHPADYVRAYFWTSLASTASNGGDRGQGRIITIMASQGQQMRGELQRRLSPDQIEAVDRAIQSVQASGVSPVQAEASLGPSPAQPLQENAARGYVDSQFALAESLMQAHDTAGALKWYTAAAAQGYPQAVAKLGEIYSNGTAPDLPSAILWAERAAQQSGWCCQREIEQRLIQLYTQQRDYYHVYFWALVTKRQSDPAVVATKMNLSQAQIQIAKMNAEKWKPEPPRTFNKVPPGQ